MDSESEVDTSSISGPVTNDASLDELVDVDGDDTES